MHYLSNVLGIKDPIHKQKIALKAMDVVLFGPPKGNILLLLYHIMHRVYICLPGLNTYIIINRYWTQYQRFDVSHIVIWSTYWMLVRISAKEKFAKTSS